MVLTAYRKEIVLNKQKKTKKYINSYYCMPYSNWIYNTIRKVGWERLGQLGKNSLNKI